MKNLLLILVLFASCAKEDPKPTSIEGKWKFSTKEISGEFEIVNYSGKLTVDNGPGGFFVIAGTKYEITVKQTISGSMPGPVTFYLIKSNPDGANISLRNIDVNKTYDQLTTSLYDYHAGGKDFNRTDKIILTR